MEGEGEEGAPNLGSSMPYLGLVGQQIDDEPYDPDEPNKAFITGVDVGLGRAGSSGEGRAEMTPEMTPRRDGDMGYDLNGLTPDPYNHDAAKDRLKQYKKEAEIRQKKKMIAQQKEAERLNAELALERERMKSVTSKRDAEAKAKQSQKFDRARQDREDRAKHRDELSSRAMEAQKSGSAAPLFKRKEEEIARRLAEEEKERRAKLREHQAHFKKIDFVELDREYRSSKTGEEGGHSPRAPSRFEKLCLPPVNEQVLLK